MAKQEIVFGIFGSFGLLLYSIYTHDSLARGPFH